MMINIFTLVILFIVLKDIIRSKNIKQAYVKVLTTAICVEAFIGIGYSVRIGDIQFTYSELTLFILSILAVIILIKGKINRRLIVIAVLLISSVIISNCSLVLMPLKTVVNPYGGSWDVYLMEGIGTYPELSMQTILMSTRIIMLVIIVLATNAVFNENVLEKITFRYIYMLRIYLIYLVIEFITKNLIGSNILAVINEKIFGLGEYTLLNLLDRGGIYVLQGLLREPSHLGVILLYSGIILCIGDKELKNIWMHIGVFVFLVLGGSLTSIIGSLILLIVYICVHKDKIKKRIVYICLSSIIILFLSTNIIIEFMTGEKFIYYVERVKNAINLLNGGALNINLSEHIRIQSVLESLELLFMRPLFGVGIGTTHAFGFLTTFLATAGVIGFVSWIMLVTNCTGEKYSTMAYLLLIVLGVGWIVIGDMGTAYSLVVLLIFMLLSRINLNVKENRICR